MCDLLLEGLFLIIIFIDIILLQNLNNNKELLINTNKNI